MIYDIMKGITIIYMSYICIYHMYLMCDVVLSVRLYILSLCIYHISIYLLSRFYILIRSDAEIFLSGF